MYLVTFNFEDGEELSIFADDPSLAIAEQIRMRGKSAIKTFSARKANTVDRRQIEFAYPRSEIVDRLQLESLGKRQ